MRKRPVLLALATCAVFGLAQTSKTKDERTLRPQQEAPAPATERRVALVIGNGAYQDAPLKNPPNDAKAMAAALREVGFEVEILTDAGRKKMLEAVRNFGQKLSAGGVGLFYYAGHGMQVKGANYLIPVGVDIANEEDVQTEALDANTVLARMDAAKNRVNLVILDACRNNPFARSFRSGTRGLAQMEAPSGTFVAFATAPGSTAADGDGQNGLYTQHLLKALKEPGVGVEQVFKRVRVSVKQASRDQQVPWDSSSLTGNFYFRPGTVAPTPGPTPPPLPIPGPAVRTVDTWLAWQTEFDLVITQLRSTLADTSRTSESKLQALREAQERWADDNPYSSRDKSHRKWMKEQFTSLVLSDSQNRFVSVIGSLNEEGLDNWTRAERNRIKEHVAGQPSGDAWLNRLQASASSLSLGRDPLAAPAHPETLSKAEHIVARHIEAIGGIDVLNRVKSFRAVETYHKDGSSLSMFYGGREPYDLIRTQELAPNRIRIDLESRYGSQGSVQRWQDRYVTSACREKGWSVEGNEFNRFLPPTQSKWPPAKSPNLLIEDLPAHLWEGPLARWQQVGGQVAFQNTKIPVIAWNTNGHPKGFLEAETQLVPTKHPEGRLEYLGEAPFPRTQSRCHKLQWTPKTGDPTAPVLFWVDSQTYLLTAAQELKPDGQVRTRVLSQWRPVGGIMLPHESVQIETKNNQDEVFEPSSYTYEVNPDLPEPRFDLSKGAGTTHFPSLANK